MANIFEITKREIEIVGVILCCFDPVAAKLYHVLFCERNEASSEFRLPMKQLARKLHVRETNLKRARRTLEALGLIKEKSRGETGRITITVRPYCASVLRILMDECHGELPLVLKRVYRLLKLYEPYLRDEYKIYRSERWWKGRKVSRSPGKAPVRWSETKVLDLTPEVVVFPVFRYLPNSGPEGGKISESEPETSVTEPVQRPANSTGEATELPEKWQQLLDYDKYTAADYSAMREMMERAGFVRKHFTGEATETAENLSKPIESTASCEDGSEIPILVSTDVLNNGIHDLNYSKMSKIIYSYNFIIKVTSIEIPSADSIPTIPAGSILAADVSSGAATDPLPTTQDTSISTKGSLSLTATGDPAGSLVFIPAVGIAFLNDDSNLVFSNGRWIDYDAPTSSPEAAGGAEGLKVMVGHDEIVIRAGNRRKLQSLFNDWKEMSAYEATYMVWETWNDATKHIPTVVRMEIRQRISDGAGRRDSDFMRAYEWVTSHFSNWGELWFRLLAGIETNAMLRGTGPSHLNIKSHPSFSWLFSNPGGGRPGVRIDRFLRGDFRWSELKADGKTKYHWIDWHDKENDEWAETYMDPDYGDIKI
jgi:hypothetical protein